VATVLDYLNEEKRNIDFILDQKAKVFDWQIDLLRLDLTSIQRTLLIRHRSRGEGLAEIAIQTGMKEDVLGEIFLSTMNRLQRYRKSLEGKTRSLSLQGAHKKVCQSCGAVTARRHSEFCDRCSPREYIGFVFKEAR
jgi:hypothetical protein